MKSNDSTVRLNTLKRKQNIKNLQDLSYRVFIPLSKFYHNGMYKGDLTISNRHYYLDTVYC